MHVHVPLSILYPGSYLEAEYDYDLIVIGGGSGGLACSKEGKGHTLRAVVEGVLHVCTSSQPAYYVLIDNC